MTSLRYEEWAARKDEKLKFKRSWRMLEKEAKLYNYASVKYAQRVSLRNAFHKESMQAYDDELTRQGLLKGGILKVGSYTRKDRGGHKKK